MNFSTPPSEISGRAMQPADFRVHRTHRFFDPLAARKVLHGELAAYRISGFVSPDECRRIVKNFWSAAHSPRYGIGEDGVEAYILGASHIEKSTDSYLSEVDRVSENMRTLFGNVVNPIARFRSLIVDQGVVSSTRPARHGDRAAGDSKFVSWNNSGSFALLPHEDLAQLSDPLQYGFEIQKLRRVMAVNVYPQAAAGSGQLKLWNIEPDDRTRSQLGVTVSGYPYPLELLHNHANLTIPIETGDLCLINGNLIHAVLGSAGSSRDRRRLLLTCFTGLNEDSELVYWT